MRVCTRETEKLPKNFLWIKRFRSVSYILRLRVLELRPLDLATSKRVRVSVKKSLFWVDLSEFESHSCTRCQMRLRLCLKNKHLPFYVPYLLLRSLSVSPKSVNCEYLSLKFRWPSKGPVKDTCVCTRNLEGSARQGKIFPPIFGSKKCSCVSYAFLVFSRLARPRETCASQMKPVVCRHLIA